MIKRITTDAENRKALKILNSMFNQSYSIGTIESDYMEMLVNEIMRYESLRFKDLFSDTDD